MGKREREGGRERVDIVDNRHDGREREPSDGGEGGRVSEKMARCGGREEGAGLRDREDRGDERPRRPPREIFSGEAATRAPNETSVEPPPPPPNNRRETPVDPRLDPRFDPRTIGLELRASRASPQGERD